MPDLPVIPGNSECAIDPFGVLHSFQPTSLGRSWPMVGSLPLRASPGSSVLRIIKERVPLISCLVFNRQPLKAKKTHSLRFQSDSRQLDVLTLPRRVWGGSVFSSDSGRLGVLTARPRAVGPILRALGSRPGHRDAQACAVQVDAPGAEDTPQLAVVCAETRASPSSMVGCDCRLDTATQCQMGKNWPGLRSSPDIEGYLLLRSS